MKDQGKTIVSIFTALKRNFPMKIDMMEKHPLGSQAFIPMKETTFLVFVAPKEEKLDLNKVEAFIIPPGIGINYNPGTWHFPLISTENMNFLVVAGVPWTGPWPTCIPAEVGWCGPRILTAHLYPH